MILAFNVLLMVVMAVSVVGVIAEKEDIKLRKHLTALFATSTVAFIASIILL